MVLKCFVALSTIVKSQSDGLNPDNAYYTGFYKSESNVSKTFVIENAMIEVAKRCESPLKNNLSDLKIILRLLKIASVRSNNNF